MQRTSETQQWFCDQVRACETGLYRLAMGLLQNRQDAEDAIQEALCSAYEKLDKLRERDKFRPWLMKILTNTAYDILRRRRPTVALEEVEPWAEEPFEDRLHLWHAVQKLPEDYRAVVILFYYEDMEIRQIGEAMGIGEGTVKTRLFRARQRLKALLEA